MAAWLGIYRLKIFNKIRWNIGGPYIGALAIGHLNIKQLHERGIIHGWIMNRTFQRISDPYLFWVYLGLQINNFLMPLGSQYTWQMNNENIRI